jgi:hypothetical protein
MGGGTGDDGETKQYTLDVLNTDKRLLLLLMGMPLQLRKQALFISKQLEGSLMSDD